MTRRGAVVKVGEKVVVDELLEERGGGRAAEKEMDDDEAWAGPTAKEVIVVELLMLVGVVVGGAARCRLAREEVGAGDGVKGGGRSGAVADGAADRTPLMSDITGAARPTLPTTRWLAPPVLVGGAVGKKGAAGAARGSDGMVVAGTPAPTKRAAEDVGANWGGRCCCCCCPVSPVEELAQPLVPPPPKSVAFFAGELPNVLKDMLLPLVVQRCSFFSG